MFFVACLVRSFGFRVKTSILLLFAGDTAHIPVDLSKATRLKDATFSCGTPSVLWIIVALQTITLKYQDLQKISIYAPHTFTLDGAGANIRRIAGETAYRQWLDLDRLLVQFWESRSIRPRIVHSGASREGKEEATNCIRCLLPEITRRGIIHLVEYHSS
jgi:hypothetical protein